MLQRNISVLKEEYFLTLFTGNRDSQYLLGNDWQHLQIDTVELVETWPGTWWGQTFEEFTHGLVIQTIWAIKHHTLSSQSLSQILNSLSFTSASRSFGSTSVVQIQSTTQCSIASVGKWGDDQPGRVT